MSIARCAHEHKTLCGEYNRDADTFVAWQCDDCGMITDDEVAVMDLYRRDLPAIDQNAFEAAIEAVGNRLVPERTAAQALEFLADAVRR